jgi:flagellar basal-body rod modification protein FlgD
VDLSQLGSIANSPAAARVASALAPETRAKATAKDTTTSGGGTSTPTTDNSTITSNDFLTLLVNELKNQDPTQPTDPNAYISQLVGVNSLQQLIQINQGLSKFETTITG